MIPPTDERAVSAIKAALKWAKAHNVRWTASEQKIYSKEHEFSGTLDGTGLVDSCGDATCCTEQFKDRLSLIDFKTSNYLYSDFLAQTAGYQGALQEEFPATKIHDRWILRLGKDDAEFDPWFLPGSTFVEDYDYFLACLALKRIVIKAEERLKVQKQGVRAAKKAAKESAKELAIAAAKVAKAEARAEAKILKAEEKKRIQEDAKVAREAAKVEAKRAKENAKDAEQTKNTDESVPIREKVRVLQEESITGTAVGPTLFKTLMAAPFANVPEPNEALRKALQQYDVGELSEEQYFAKVSGIPMELTPTESKSTISIEEK